VTIGFKCETFAVEMVVRATSPGTPGVNTNRASEKFCGVSMPDGLKENDKLPKPIITPTTKASVGHDEDIFKRRNFIQGNCW